MNAVKNILLILLCLLSMFAVAGCAIGEMRHLKQVIRDMGDW